MGCMGRRLRTVNGNFVHQLQSRQFFDLAEQFCERRIESCRTSGYRAEWQFLLADSVRSMHGR